MSESINLRVCLNCVYRDIKFNECGFDPSKSTVSPACDYTFPAFKIAKIKIISGGTID